MLLIIKIDYHVGEIVNVLLDSARDCIAAFGIIVMQIQELIIKLKGLLGWTVRTELYEVLRWYLANLFIKYYL